MHFAKASLLLASRKYALLSLWISTLRESPCKKDTLGKCHFVLILEVVSLKVKAMKYIF